MISYGKQSVDQLDIDAVVEVLNGDWLTQGSGVETFENNLKIYFGAKNASAVANGTAALHLAGLALGWQTDDVIITSPITFLATANSIVYTGATPEFADIDPVSYTIDPNQVEDKIKIQLSKLKNVKAVIGVDYAGHVCDWEALRSIADQYDIQLVNDNSHALGALYFGDKQFAVKYADVVTQSYHPVKHITTGEGGAVLTNDPEIAEKVRCLRTHGIKKGLDLQDGNYEPWYYEMHDIGFNYRITDFQCALGSSQLNKLNRFVHKRREIAKRYAESFSGMDILIAPKTKSSIEHAYHLYPLQIEFEKLLLTKAGFFQKMKEEGINLQVHYIPVHLQPYYKNQHGFKKGDFPVSEKFYEREVSLPMYPSLNYDDQQRVTKSLYNLLRI